MKLRTLTVVLLVGGSSLLLHTPANGVWLENVHGSNGVRGFLIGGEFAPKISGSERRFNFVYKNPEGHDIAHLQEFFDNMDKEARIEREALRPQADVTNAMFFRLSRRVNATDVIVGTLVLAPDQRNLIDTTPIWGIHYARENFGDLAVGRMGVSINPQATGTYTPFTTVNRSSGGMNGVTATFDKYANWEAKAFYSLPTAENIGNLTTPNIHRGWGAQASYTYKISPNHFAKVSGGYSTFSRHPGFNNRQLLPMVGGASIYQAPVKEHNFGASLTYKYTDWTASIDYGRKESIIPDAPIVDGATIDNIGVKISYDVTPRLEVSGAYGIQKSKAQEAIDGYSLTTPMIFPAPDPGRPHMRERLQRRVLEQYLFDEIHSQQVKLDAAYKFTSNFTGVANVTHEYIENYVPDGKFSERQNTQYSVGLNYFF